MTHRLRGGAIIAMAFGATLAVGTAAAASPAPAALPEASRATALAQSQARTPSARGTLDHAKLEAALAALAKGGDGRLGACAMDASGIACVNGDQRFSLQSVMKLIGSIAVMDAVDHKGWTLDDEIIVRREDLSVYVQPIAKKVTPEGYRSSVRELVHLAVTESDSAAIDILVARLGGPRAVQATLDRLGVKDVRFDRDERTLQTDIVGLTWRPEFVDPKQLDAAIAKVPEAKRAERYRAYQRDPRDTATPKGMAAMLHALATGKLLSPASTKFLLDVMRQTTTMPDRLKAGLSGTWELGHKTGTSGTWRGVTAATNDVGFLIAPDGTPIAIVAFVADSRDPSPKRAATIADVTRATIAAYR